MISTTFLLLLTFVLGDFPARPGRSVLVNVARVEADALRESFDSRVERKREGRGERSNERDDASSSLSSTFLTSSCAGAAIALLLLLLLLLSFSGGSRENRSRSRCARRRELKMDGRHKKRETDCREGRRKKEKSGEKSDFFFFLRCTFFRPRLFRRQSATDRKNRSARSGLSSTARGMRALCTRRSR